MLEISNFIIILNDLICLVHALDFYFLNIVKSMLAT